MMGADKTGSVREHSPEPEPWRPQLAGQLQVAPRPTAGAGHSQQEPGRW